MSDLDAINTLVSGFMNPESSTYPGMSYVPQSQSSGAAGVGARLGSMFGGPEGANIGGLLGNMFGGNFAAGFGDSPHQSYYTRQLAASRQRALTAFNQQQLAPLASAFSAATGVDAATAAKYLPVAGMFAPGALQAFARGTNANYFDNASVAALENVASLGIVQNGIGASGQEAFYASYFNQMGGIASRLAHQGISSGAVAHAGLFARRTVRPDQLFGAQFAANVAGFASSIHSISQSLGVDSATAAMLGEQLGGGRSLAGMSRASRMLSDIGDYGTAAGIDPNLAISAGLQSAAGAGLNSRFGGMIAQRMTRAAALVGNLDASGQSDYHEAAVRGVVSAAKSAEGLAMAHALTHGDADTKRAAMSGRLDLKQYYSQNYNRIRLNDTGSNLKALTPEALASVAYQQIQNTGTNQQRAIANGLMSSNNVEQLAAIAEKGLNSDVMADSKARQFAVARLSQIAPNDERLRKVMEQIETGKKGTDASPDSIAKSMKDVVDSSLPVINKLTAVLTQLVSALGNDLKAVREIAKGAANTVVKP